MIDFGITQHSVDTVDLIAKIAEVRLGLSELAEYERRADREIASYINGKDCLDESDRETIKVIRDAIFQERDALRVKLFGLTDLQNLENNFRHLVQ